MDLNYFKKTKILDGGMGQELLAKGLVSKGTLWSTSAILDENFHQLLIDVHISFINAGADVIVTNNFSSRKICKDNKEDIKIILKEWTHKKDLDVIITTGGTGLTGRDITPEALNEIADKHIPGFGEIFRYYSLETVGTSSIQSRACAILSNGKYIFALPGSSGGVTDAWDKILVHQLDINHKPCNFVELFPRLKEK